MNQRPALDAIGMYSEVWTPVSNVATRRAAALTTTSDTWNVLCDDDSSSYDLATDTIPLDHLSGAFIYREGGRG